MNRTNEAPCRYCGGPAKPWMQTRDWNQRVSAEIFNYIRCDNCGLVSLSAIPEDLAPYYPKNYHTIPQGARPRPGQRKISGLIAHLRTIRRQRSEQRKLDLLLRFISRGKLLEIGPSWGGFSQAAKNAGFDVDVIEMNPECRRFLSDVLHVNVLEGANENTALRKAGLYDAIVLWQVLEHLKCPWEILDELASKLKPGGYLAIGTPNPDSLQRRVFGSRWLHVDAPRHVTLIPVAWPQRVLGRHGLRAVLATATDKPNRDFNAVGWRSSLSNALPKQISFLSKALGLGLSILAYPVESFSWLGSCYTIILKKDA